MSNFPLEKTRAYGRTIGAALVECVLILGSFLLFSSRFNLNALKELKLVLIISYPFLIAICTGLVAASIAQMKHLAGWKWGGLATAITLFLILMLVSLPSFVSEFAFLIAPVVAIAVSLNAMDVRETNPSE